MLLGLACAQAVVFSVAQPAAAEDPATVLAAVEAQLASNPDNLRLASKYRQSVIQAGEYDRALKFFEQLVADHPNSANAHLNFGFAYVDKIPVAGSITQVILANNGLNEFTKSLELQATWLAYYTRGTSYLYWPQIFGRAALGVADLEEAMKIQKAEKNRGYHVRAYLALGDGYWKMDDLDKAKQVWAEGRKQFPDDRRLQERLSKEGDDLKAVIDETYDITRRVDTSLEVLWADEDQTTKK